MSSISVVICFCMFAYKHNFSFRLIRLLYLLNVKMKKKKNELEKRYELVEKNWYKAPRYMRDKVKHIMELSDMFMENYFNKYWRFKY